MARVRYGILTLRIQLSLWSSTRNKVPRDVRLEAKVFFIKFLGIAINIALETVFISEVQFFEMFYCYTLKVEVYSYYKIWQPKELSQSHHFLRIFFTLLQQCLLKIWLTCLAQRV